MRKTKYILTGLLCAALAVPPVNAGAAIINRHSTETSKDDTSGGKEEEIDVDTTEEVDEDEIVTKDTIKKEIADPADIVFVIDSTGSMSPYIKNVADNLKAFSEYIEEKVVDGKKIDVRMAVVEYKDITCDGKDSTNIYTVDGKVWHKSTAELVETLGKVRANVNGGGDGPETVIDGLGYIVDGKTFDFGREGTDTTHKFAIVLTDADFKENNNFGYTEESIIEKLKEQNVNTTVITSKYAHDAYLKLTGDKDKIFDINAKDFSEELKKLADEIVRTIEEEIEDVKVVKTIKIVSDGKGTIDVGDYTKLSAVIPETAKSKEVKWSVSDKSVISLKVSEDTQECTATGVGEGTATVTATTKDGGFKGTYKINVVNGAEDEPTIAIEVAKEDITVTPSKKTISKNKSFNIKVALTKEFTEDKEKEEIDDIWDSNIDSITYRSSKSSIASVNNKGKVTGKKKGKTTIKTTVVLADGTEYTYKTTVYVK